MDLIKYYKEQEQKGNVKINFNEKLGIYSVSYMHGGVDFRDEKLRIARGLGIDLKGNIVIRGFEKFFNYKQLEDWEFPQEFKDKYSGLDYELNEKIEVEDKLDGTLILLSVYNNEFIVGTTSSTESPYSENAVNYFNQLENADELKEELKGKTLIFEYISPTNQIVVKYSKPEYVILGLIENDSGKEFDYEYLFNIGHEFGLRVYEKMYMTLNELLYEQKNNKQIEGYIVRNKYNKRIKIKTDYWFEQSEMYSIFHGNKLTRRRIGAVVQSYADDTLDDLIAYANQHENLGGRGGHLKTIINVVDKYIKEADKYYTQYEQGKIDRTTIAKLRIPIKGLVFNKIEGKVYITNKSVAGIRENVYKELCGK